MVNIKNSYYFLSFGVLLNLSAYIGLMTLQSCINIRHNIGTICASVLFIAAAVLSLFVSPLLMLRAGIKWSLIIGETGFLFYTLANFYPKLEVMVFGALLGAFGEALIWTSNPVYINYLLHEYWEKQKDLDKSLTEDMMRNKWLAKYLVILKFSLVFGNALSYGALYIGRNIGQLNNLTVPSNLSYCGGHFHVEKVDQELDLEYFVPQNKFSVYMLLSLYLILQVLSVVIHVFFIPRLRQSDETKNAWKITCNTLISTLSHVKSFNHILLIPLYFYYGLLISYNMAVFSRAFLSCGLGVQLVGLGMAIQGLANIAMTLIAGRFSFHFGLTPIVIFALIFESCIYIVQLMWTINYHTRYYIFLLAACSGITGGTWQLTLICLTALYFNEKQEIAYSVQTLWCVLGMFVGFMLASTIAVHIHIWILISFLITGCVGYGTIEYIRLKRCFYPDKNSFLIKKDELSNNSSNVFENDNSLKVSKQ